VGRWIRIDRRYNQPYRLTSYASRAIFKWVGLVLAWAIVNGILAADHLGVLDLATTAALIWYAVHCARRNQGPRLAPPAYSPIMPTSGQWQQPATTSQWWLAAPMGGEWQLNTPPNWPSPPPDWSPGPGWQPDPSWPLPPPGWQLWVPPAAPGRGAPGERNSRAIPQDVRIAVSARDQDKCVQCGSTENVQFDHKIPWSRGGANTVNNIQLLCGRCNRRKGANDSPQ
jgi:hypothetical protein